MSTPTSLFHEIAAGGGAEGTSPKTVSLLAAVCELHPKTRFEECISSLKLTAISPLKSIGQIPRQRKQVVFQSHPIFSAGKTPHALQIHTWPELQYAAGRGTAEEWVFGYGKTQVFGYPGRKCHENGGVESYLCQDIGK